MLIIISTLMGCQDVGQADDIDLVDITTSDKIVLCPTGSNRWYYDQDGDGEGDRTRTTCSTAALWPYGFVRNPKDCDDSDDTVNTAAAEVCADGVDNDCDKVVDDQTTWYADDDLDTYGDPDVSTLSCDQPSGYVSDNTDCDDADNTVHPSATETCNGVDDDCDGVVDDGLSSSTFYTDDDEDGYGDSANSVSACAAPSGYVSDNTDCNDTNSAVHPGATESVNGVDDDCDGSIDEGTTACSSTAAAMTVDVIVDSATTWSLSVANVTTGDWTKWFTTSSTTVTGDDEGTISVTAKCGDQIKVNGNWTTGWLFEAGPTDHVSSITIGGVSYSIGSASSYDCYYLTNGSGGYDLLCTVDK